MKKRIVVFAVFVAGLWTAPLRAQSFLPSSFGAWASSGEQPAVPGTQIGQLANDQAPVIREFGVSSGERREYSSGTRSASVTLYRMVDPSAAFGAFTFLRDPEMAPLPLDNSAAYSAEGHNRALFVVGNFVVDVASSQGTPSGADLRFLASSLTQHADRRPFPILARFLPKNGLVTGSERYALGPQALAQAFPPGATIRADWAGFASSAEGIVATYRFPGQKSDRQSLLLLISYPTQQLAADRYAALNKWFALNAEASEPGDKPVIFGTRSSALIALFAGAGSRETATSLLSQIHYASEVTWNEAGQKYTDPSISTIVVGAIVDTGAIMLLALAAGIGFGGFRLLMKFAFPGRVFDRNDEVEILQLGLSSKPIQAKDFYLLNSSRGS